MVAIVPNMGTTHTTAYAEGGGGNAANGDPLRKRVRMTKRHRVLVLVYPDRHATSTAPSYRPHEAMWHPPQRLDQRVRSRWHRRR